MGEISKSQTIDGDMLTAVADEVLSAWQQNHGTTHGNAYTMVGPEGVAVFIEEAFSPAEHALAAREMGNDLLNRYAKSLLEQVCADQQGRIASAAGRAVTTTGVSADPVAGWVMCFFRLADP